MVIGQDFICFDRAVSSVDVELMSEQAVLEK